MQYLIKLHVPAYVCMYVHAAKLVLHTAAALDSILKHITCPILELKSGHLIL